MTLCAFFFGTVILTACTAAWGIHGYFAAVNFAALAFFALDKLAAIRGIRRFPEKFLLGTALAGGSPGACLAMCLFNHKKRKTEFMLPFSCVILFQIVILVIWGTI